MKAIIGGTGVDRDKRFLDGAERIVTRYGEAFYTSLDDIIYLPRHSPGHSVPPHMINYKANVQALVELGVDTVISIYAVGSITRRLSPGRFGLVHDFIDLAFSRENTFYDGSTREVRHVPFVEPFDRKLGALFARTAVEEGHSLAMDSVYISTNGPRLETPAEIVAYRNMGADIVGMTLGTEAALLKEAGIRNAAVAYSINWAAGLDAEGISFLEEESIDRLVGAIMSIAVKTLAKV